MTDLEDLEEIVEQNCFGTMSAMVFSGARATPVSRLRDICGRGHDLMVTGRWYKSAKSGVRRRRCIQCAREDRGYQGIYCK